MEFLLPSPRRYSSQNSLSGEERGETAVLAGFFFFHFSVFLNLSFPESSSEIILPFLKRQKRRSVDT